MPFNYWARNLAQVLNVADCLIQDSSQSEPAFGHSRLAIMGLYKAERITTWPHIKPNGLQLGHYNGGPCLLARTQDEI